MKRKLLCFCLVVSSGCSLLKDQVDFGNISASDALSVGADAYNAVNMSDEEVIQIARQVAQYQDQNNKIAPPSSPYAKRLAKLVAQHGQEDGLKLNYKVYLSPEINAFSLADGTVRVYSGLMDKMNDEELFFVIGHEIGHVKSGHSKSRMQRAYAASAATKAASAGLASGAGSSVGALGVAVAGDLVASLAAEVVTAQFSQGDEIESDEYGLQFLRRGGHQPAAAVQALVKLADDSGEGSGDAGEMFNQLTATHPDPLARAEHIRELIPNLPQGGESATGVVAENEESQEASATLADQAVASEGGAHTAIAPSQDEVAARSRYERKRVATGDWVVQVGSFADKARALQVMDTLLQQSRSAQIEEFPLQGASFYRVIVGPYATRNEAAQGLAEVAASSAINPGAFVRRASHEEND